MMESIVGFEEDEIEFMGEVKFSKLKDLQSANLPNFCAEKRKCEQSW